MADYVTPVNQFLRSIDPQPYERYLPNAFNESLSLLEKVNKVIYALNETNQVSSEVIQKWNEFVELANSGQLVDNQKIVDLVDSQLMPGFKKEIQDSTNKTLNQVSKELSETKKEIQQLSLSFKESFETVQSLKNAYPNGDNSNHVVLSDNMIYSYKNDWISTGIQANGTGIVDKGVSVTKFDESVHLLNKLLFSSGTNKKINPSATSLCTVIDNKITFTGAGYTQFNFDFLGFTVGNKVNFIVKSNQDHKDLADYIRVRTSELTVFTPSVYLGNGLYAILDYQIMELPRNLFIDNRTLNIPNLQLELFVGFNEYPLMNAEYSKVIGKVNEVTTQNQIRYVSKNGSDNTKNGLSESDAFATLQKALDSGANTIYIQRGVYYNQSVKKSKENVTILPLDNGTQKVEFRGSDKLNNASWLPHNSIFKQPYSGNVYFKQVFIDKSLPPIASGTRPSYNATIWEGNDRINDIKLKPVLTLTECESEQGTFFYDGTTLYLNPTGGVIGDKEYNAVKLNSGLDLRGSGQVTLQDIVFDFYMNEPINLDNVKKVDIRNCDTGHSVLSDGISADDTNGRFADCKSFKNRNDGYNLHNTGNTEFYNCEGFNNYDDGISHHDKCTFLIVGGKWYGNGKGGIAPSYGAKGNWYNCLIEGNKYGIYQDSYTGVDNISSGNLYLSNETAILNNQGLKSVTDKFVSNGKNFHWSNSVDVY